MSPDLIHDYDDRMNRFSFMHLKKFDANLPVYFVMNSFKILLVRLQLLSFFGRFNFRKCLRLLGWEIVIIIAFSGRSPFLLLEHDTF